MKKTLSIILALAMLISLVPSAFASEESATEPELELAYNYDFGAAGYGDGTSEIGIDTLKTYGDTVVDGVATSNVPTRWAKTNTDQWVVDGQYRADGAAAPALTGVDIGTSTTKVSNALYWGTTGLRVWKTGETVDAGSALAIRIKIEQEGTYIPKLTYQASENSCKYKVYLVPIDDFNATQIKGLAFSTVDGKVQQTYLTGNVKTVATKKAAYFLGEVDMYESPSREKTWEADSKYQVEEGGEYCLLFYSSGLNKAISDKYVNKNGPAVYTNLNSFKLYTEKKENTSIDSSFDYTEEEFVGGSATLRAFAVYGEGTESEEDIIGTRAITIGETVSVEAPVSVTKGEKIYNFLYWAKGATNKKQIVSYNAAFTYKAYAEANNLIAVYKEKGAESSSKEYYNANGQLMENGNTLPYLPGYGRATGWADAGNGVYVAEYAPLAKNIEVTVNGEKETVAYGDTVTCTASAPEGKVFMYWTKNDEIVSTESTYTFSAWETATVTAVYGDSAPTLGKTMRKILLDTMTVGEDTAVMAEFIGFSDAVEKGIIFGGKKIPMLTDKSQFTLTNDTDGTVTVTGYAIINDGGTLKEISDGSISVD